MRPEDQPVLIRMAALIDQGKAARDLSGLLSPDAAQHAEHHRGARDKDVATQDSIMSPRKSALHTLAILILIAMLLAGCVQPLARMAASAIAPAPTATLMTGWKRFENEGVSLAMPDTYVGGDLTAADQQTIIENLKELGGDFARIAEIMKRNPDVYVLFVIDAEPTAGGVFTNANVGREKVVSAIDVDMYVSAFKEQLPGSVKIKSQTDITLLDEPAVHLLIETTIGGIDVTQVMYLLKHDNYMYAITFATDSAAFEEKLPIFEHSIQSLAVNPEP